MSLKPVLPGNLVQVPSQSSGGGSGGLPQWTFLAGSGPPADGQFVLDNADPSAATKLTISYYPKGNIPSDLSIYNVLSLMPCPGTGVLLTDSAGKTIGFPLISNQGVGETIEFNLGSPVSADSTALSGDYSLSFFPCGYPDFGGLLSASGITPIMESNSTISNSLGGNIANSHGILTGVTPAT